MKPHGQLMIEHRVIEKMIGIIKQKKDEINEGNYDPFMVDALLDFIRIYADWTHHCKEDDILFFELSKKDLEMNYSMLLKELAEEHVLARSTVKQLIDINENFKKTGTIEVENFKNLLSWLIDFYPEHIRKEDTILFPGIENYLTSGEQDLMLEKFWESDRKKIHEKYNDLIEGLLSKYQ